MQSANKNEHWLFLTHQSRAENLDYRYVRMGCGRPGFMDVKTSKIGDLGIFCFVIKILCPNFPNPHIISLEAGPLAAHYHPRGFMSRTDGLLVSAFAKMDAA